MGLLDQAIREHLELKRQHGADPGEVARLEREALGPPVRETQEALERQVARMTSLTEQVHEFAQGLND